MSIILSRKKILVTGGCGFIGSHIANTLSTLGANVTVLDNMSLGVEKNLIKKVKLIKGDITDFGLVRDIVSNTDVVFHEAAASSAPMFKRNMEDPMKTNIQGFINILEAIRITNEYKGKNIRLVFASSSSIYGSLKKQTEDAKVYPPNFYSATKYFDEHLARIYYETHGVESIGLRYFSVFGENEQHKGKYANVVSQFIWNFIKGEQPIIYGDGKQTRDFIYVKDVVRANILAAASPIKFGIYNIGTGRETSFNQLITMIKAKMISSIEPKYVENPIKNYVMHTKADTKKARKELGFKAKTILHKALDNVIRHYITMGVV